MIKLQLMQVITQAIVNKKDYLFIRIENHSASEIVIVGRKDFIRKKEYYQKAYDSNLKHVMNDCVRIVAASSGDINDLNKFVEEL